MVITNFPFESENTGETEREISILYALGLEDYEVEYLLHLKEKTEASKKWN